MWVRFNTTSKYWEKAVDETDPSSLFTQLDVSAAAIVSGNLAVARMPTGGTWSLSTDLTVSGATIITNTIKGATHGEIWLNQSYPTLFTATSIVLVGTASKPNVVVQLKATGTSGAFVVADNAGNVGHYMYAGGRYDNYIGSNGVAIVMQPTGRLYFDAGGDTYISETSADILTVVVGGSSSAQFVASGIVVTSGDKIYLDGGDNTYILENGADVMMFYAGGNRTCYFYKDYIYFDKALVMAQGVPIYFDGGTHTSINEGTNDQLYFYLGGTLACLMSASGFYQVVNFQTTTSRPNTYVGTNGYFYKTSFVQNSNSATCTTQSGAIGGSWADTGLTVTITPSTSGSKILISCTVYFVGAYSNGHVSGTLRLLRDSTDICQFGASSSYAGTAYHPRCCVTYLDSPATTSTITYKVQGIRSEGSDPNYMYAQYANYPSVITVLEV